MDGYRSERINEVTNSYSLPYALMMRTMMEINNKMVYLLLNRSEGLVDVGIQIWRSRVFCSKEADLEVFEDPNITVMYNDSYSRSLLFKEPEAFLDERMFFSKEIPFEVYMKFMGVTSLASKKIARFYPNAYEVSVAKTLNLLDDLHLNTGKTWRSADTEKADKVRAAMVDLINVSIKQKEVIEHMDVESFSSFVTEIAQRTTITAKEMTKYLHNRHEIFASTMMSSIMREEAVTDTWALKRYNLDKDNNADELAPSDKTPDYIIEKDENTDYWIEFTVTRSSWELAVMSKEDKYSPLKVYVEKNSTKKIEIVVVVLTIPDRHIRTNTNEMVFSDTVNLDFLFEIMDMAESIPNYSAMQSMTEMQSDGLDIRTISEKKTVVMKEVFDLETLKDIKTIPLSAAFTNEEMDLNSAKFVSTEADKIAAEIQSIESVAGFDKLLLREVAERYKREDYTFEVKQIMESTTFQVKERMNMHLENQKQRRMMMVDRDYFNKAVPKMFKMPMIPTERVTAPSLMKDGWTPTHYLKDGSILVRHMREIPKVETDLDFSVVNRAGIGISDDDEDLLTTIHSRLFSSEVTTDFVDAFRTSPIYSCLVDMEEMMRNIMYLCDRRFVMTSSHWDESNPLEKTAAKFGIMKDFERYTIFVHKGTKITKDKQINVKVAFNSDETFDTDNPFFRTWYKKNDIGDYSTKWFTVSMVDMEHFSTIASRAITIVSDYQEKIEEYTGSPVRVMYKRIPLQVSFPVLIMMEHKRPTSISCQMNRYLMHSFTGVASDRVVLMDDVFDMPVRTLLQSAVMSMQARWVMSTVDKSASIVSSTFSKMASTGGNYDKLFLTSFVNADTDDLNENADEATKRGETEFSVLMNEIYFSNISNKGLGFAGHRDKEIYNKMEQQEMKFNEVKANKPYDSDWKAVGQNKSVFHAYSTEALNAMMDHYLENTVTEESINLCLERAIERTGDEVIKMTKSVYSAPVNLASIRPSGTTDVVKKTVFECFIEELEMTPTPVLLEMVRDDEVHIAIFGSFSKDQIGQPREILIQYIRTRLHTKLFNNFFEELCRIHHKEMITDEKAKVEIQTRIMDKNRQEFTKSRADESEVIKIPSTLNADSSKWAPSHAVTLYITLLKKMKINENLKSRLISVARMYQPKVIFATNKLKRKWQAAIERDPTFKEADEITESVRARMDPLTGLIVYFSGMGQGNLQHPSSFFHCIVDDYSDHVMRMFFKTFTKATVEINTLISSDDITKFFLFTCSKDDKDLIKSSWIVLMDLFTRVRKMANIHINWKKTSFQVLIAEFNSVFCVCKKVATASIKSIYNAFNIVDLTTPERAVKEALGAIRRMLEDGCYLNTIKIAMQEMRDQIRDWYCLTDTVVSELCSMLDTTEDLLPWQLGFLPLKFPLETLIFGPEFMMFDVGTSETLGKFYHNIYSDKINVSNDMVADLSYTVEDTIKSEYVIELPMRMDKNVKEMKKAFLEKEDINEIQDDVDKTTMMVNSTKHDALVFFSTVKSYPLKINRKYEISETYKLNSLVRALQMAGEKVMLKSSAKEEEYQSSIMDVVSYILRMGPVTSKVRMFDKFKQVMTEAMNVKQSMEQLVEAKSYRRFNRHNKPRKFQFYSSTLSEFATEREMITMLLSQTPEVKSRVLMAVNNLCLLMGVEMQDLIEDPLNIIRKVFSNSSKPFISFKEFIRYHNKVMASNKMMILTSNPPVMSREGNLMVLYKEKTSSMVEYTSKATLDASENEMKFVNLMTLAGSSQAKAFVDKIDIEQSVSNTQVENVMMIMKKMDKKNTVRTKSCYTGMVYYTTRVKDGLTEKVWTDFITMVILKEKSKTDLSYSIYSSEEEPERSVAYKAFIREVGTIYVNTKKKVGNNSTYKEFMTSINMKTYRKLAVPVFSKVLFKDTVNSTRVVVNLSDFYFTIGYVNMVVYADAEAEENDQIIDLLEIHRNEGVTVDRLNSLTSGMMAEALSLTQRKLKETADFKSGKIERSSDKDMRVDAVRAMKDSFFITGLDMGAAMKNLLDVIPDEDTIEDVMEMKMELADAEAMRDLEMFANAAMATNMPSEKEMVEETSKSVMKIKDILSMALMRLISTTLSLEMKPLFKESTLPDNLMASFIFTRIRELTDLNELNSLIVVGNIYKRYSFSARFPSMDDVWDLRMTKRGADAYHSWAPIRRFMDKRMELSNAMMDLIGIEVGNWADEI